MDADFITGMNWGRVNQEVEARVIKVERHMTLIALSDISKLAKRLEVLGTDRENSFAGEVYRFINPAFSKSHDIIDGSGALHANGRWNLKGCMRLSYTALAPQTALAEALAHVRYYQLPFSKALPRVLVALQLKARRVLDLRDGTIRNELKLTKKTMKNLDWRPRNQAGVEAITQAWGRVFAGAGLEAVIVPSAADPSGSNLLVFPQNRLVESRFEVESEVKWPGK